MLRYLVRRLGQALLVVLGVIVMTFVIQRVVPGDPAVAVAGPRASPEQLEAVRIEYGLDQPLPVQLWRYVSGLFRGDLGTSLHTQQPVLRDLALAFPASLQLVSLAILLAVIIGIPAGMAAARRGGRPIDFSLRLTSMVAVSVPSFFLALVLQQVFATRLGLFPVAGRGDAGDLLGMLSHAVLPVLVVAAYPTGIITQLTRAAITEEASQDHTKLERSLGFSEREILTRFSLRPALNPVVSVIALVFAYSLANMFVVEAIFDWPGLGSYAVRAISSSDTPAIAGVTLLVACVYVVVNLGVDLVQSVIDPRVRLA